MDASEAHEKPIPPAVAKLKNEDSDSDYARRQKMQRSFSQDIREEREDLKEAAEHSLNIILYLSIDGNVKWVSSSWQDVIGTPTESIIGKPIADIVIEDKNAFANAVENLQKDDSRSIIVRFSTHVGKLSALSPKSLPPDISEDAPESDTDDSKENEAAPRHTIDLEAQGIVVYDRTSGEISHVINIKIPCAFLC